MKKTKRILALIGAILLLLLYVVAFVATVFWPFILVLLAGSTLLDHVGGLEPRHQAQYR